MTSQTKAILKSYFNTGDIPTEAQFSDMFDSFTGMPATLVVAASDASQRSKDYADYVCDGTNDEVEIQAAIDAIPDVGGSIKFTEGTFYINYAGELVETTFGDSWAYCLLIRHTDPPIALIGVSGATVFKLADNQGDDIQGMLTIAGLDTGLVIRTNPTHIYGITFDGNKDNQGTDAQGPIFVQLSEMVTVDNCRFKNIRDNALVNVWGLWFHNLSRRGKVTNCHFYDDLGLVIENGYFIISNNIFDDSRVSILADYDMAGEDDTSYAMTITSNVFIGTTTTQLGLSGTRGAVISGNTFFDQGGSDYYALDIGADYGGHHHLSHNVVIGNTFYNCYNCIRLQSPGDGSYGCQYNIVALNNFMRSTAKGINNGIRIVTSANSIGNEILYNNFGPASAPLTDGGVNTIIKGNTGTGYKAENQGAASVADGGTIAHGCTSAPTIVSMTGSVAGEIVTVTSIDATNITVAIKDNDGSAGTTQTVYWRAEV